MNGGEKDRKVPLELDWDKILGSDKDEVEPPQLVVKAKKRKWMTVEDDGGGDELLERFRGVSDQELAEKIARLKKNLSIFRLPDGGEKCRISIKRHEDELERRRILKRQKDDERCKKLPQFHDLSSSRACVGSWKEAPSSQLNHGSEFATSFLKKMEKRTEGVAEDPFRKELSTLNRCDFQWKRSDGHDSALERHKGEISSRQTPFRCPSNLSMNVDRKLQSDGVQKGRCASTPLIHSKDVSATGLAKTRNSSQAQPSHDLSSRNTVVLVDEDEHETAEMLEQVDQDECMKEAKIYYPTRDDPKSMEIHFSDLECLAPEAYVSSTIMNFYIRYLQQYRYSMRKQVDYQFFNTYFYLKLKEAMRMQHDREASFAKVRRWWKDVQLFEKAYIFLPIHESLHWSLVIICIPDKEAGRGPIILHLDSLGLHSSKSIFENIRRLLIGEWEFLRNEAAHLDFPIPDKIWDNLPRRIQEKIIEVMFTSCLTIDVPQQRNYYDCGLFVLFFIERFIERAPERVKDDLTMFGRRWFEPEEASRLRHTIRNLLKEEFKKAKESNLLDA